MAKGYTNGKMAVNMQGCIMRIKKMVMEYIFGWMVDDMKDNGRMEKEMGQVRQYIRMGLRNVDFGLMIKDKI